MRHSMAVALLAGIGASCSSCNDTGGGGDATGSGSGATASGGNAGAAGNAVGQGGSATGGSAGSGGATSSGGASSGGAAGSGGITGSGGTTASGGTTGTGGAAGVGGSAGSGGSDIEPIDSGDAANGSACDHGGQCASAHCAAGMCVDPPEWSSAEILTTTPGVPDVSMPSYGNAVVAWSTDEQVLARVAMNGVFDEEIRLDTQDGSSISSSPVVDTLGNGNVYLAWSESYDRAYSRTYSGSWSDVEDVDGTGEPMALPGLALNQRGTGILLWQDRTITTFWARLFEEGVAGPIQEFPLGSLESAGVSPSGRLSVVWCLNRTIQQRRYLPGSGWEEPAQIWEGEVGINCNYPLVEVADNGDTVVTWRDSAGTSRPWSLFYSEQGGWEDPTLLVLPEEYGSGSTEALFSAGGSLMLVWVRRLGGVVATSEVYYQVREGGVWQPPTLLDVCENDKGRIALASYDRHSFRIVYHKGTENTPGTELWEARYVGGKGIVQQRAIAPAAPGGNLYPVLALDEQGRGIAVWQYWDDPPNLVPDPLDLRAMWLDY